MENEKEKHVMNERTIKKKESKEWNETKRKEKKERWKYKWMNEWMNADEYENEHIQSPYEPRK